MDVTILWDEDDDPDGNIEQLRMLGLTREDIRHAFEHGEVDTDVSNMSGWPVLFGTVEDGRPVAVLFRWERPGVVYVIDARLGS